jgi:magnesium-protoporphyrin O-methyltransferase
MSCCCAHQKSTSRLFSRFAPRYRRRFERKGFEPSQKQLLEGIRQSGIEGASLLEIGSGVGHLHQTLLEQGAASATGVDLAPRMLEEARRWAADRGLADRTRYLEGDFVELADTIDAADITILDKVVCCYPDADRLVHRSLARTRKTCALTYPRDNWLNRVGARVMGFAMWLIRSDYRSYIHSPMRIESWIRAEGFSKVRETTTTIWLTQIYVRA